MKPPKLADRRSPAPPRRHQIDERAARRARCIIENESRIRRADLAFGRPEPNSLRPRPLRIGCGSQASGRARRSWAAERAELLDPLPRASAMFDLLAGE